MEWPQHILGRLLQMGTGRETLGEEEKGAGGDLAKQGLEKEKNEKGEKMVNDQIS